MDVRSPAAAAWSPDGRRLAFQALTDGHLSSWWSLYVADADGSGLVNLSAVLPPPAGQGRDGDPDWSPDGRRLAFTVEEGGRERVYVADIAAMSLRRLTSNAERSDGHPAWSPDGRRLAFSGRHPVGTSVVTDVYVIGVDGTGERNLTQNPAEGSATMPAWSGDGQRIAFVDGEGQIQLMRSDGTPVTRLTDTGPNESPSWSWR